MNKLWVSLSLLFVIGCAHKPEAKKESTTPMASAGTKSGDTEEKGTASNACSRDLDCGPRQLCIRNQCVDVDSHLAECGSVRVFFPLNSSELPPDTATSLERSARCLKADLALHVTIEGNADERGTEEYNLALGDRRATAVATYLERLGATAPQLKTVSYGKENPLCVEHDEACWAKNRRAELNLAGGAKKAVHKK